MPTDTIKIKKKRSYRNIAKGLLISVVEFFRSKKVIPKNPLVKKRNVIWLVTQQIDLFSESDVFAALQHHKLDADNRVFYSNFSIVDLRGILIIMAATLPGVTIVTISKENPPVELPDYANVCIVYTTYNPIHA